MVVWVYQNLHKQCWSVRQNGKVIYHANQLFMKDCTFKVWEGGRQRVLRDKKKNVHAFVVGEVCVPPIDITRSVEVTYNPYKGGRFHEKSTGQSILSAGLLMFTVNGEVFSLS